MVYVCVCVCVYVCVCVCVCARGRARERDIYEVRCAPPPIYRPHKLTVNAVHYLLFACLFCFVTVIKIPVFTEDE